MTEHDSAAGGRMNPTDRKDLTAMVRAYLGAALWTWLDDDGHALFTNEEVAEDDVLTEVFDLPSIVKATADCGDFAEYIWHKAYDDQGITEEEAASWLAASNALAEMDPCKLATTSGCPVRGTAQGSGIGASGRLATD